MANDTVRIDRKNARMIAHRGVSGLEPENTLLSFVAAGNRSYFGIETDVHATADGKYLCMHDESFLRTAGVEKNIEMITAAEARAIPLFFAAKGEIGKPVSEALCVPTLAEYIAICKRYGKTAVLELKNHFQKAQVAEIITIIEELDYLGGVIFISFDFENLLFVKELHPDQTVQFLTDAVTPDLIPKLQAHGMDLDIRYKALLDDPKTIEALHEAGIKINVWTVDDPEDAARLIENGVDFITSNILE